MTGTPPVGGRGGPIEEGTKAGGPVGATVSTLERASCGQGAQPGPPSVLPRTEAPGPLIPPFS